jgi:predicted GNAT superfamily acetyltransferase
MTISPAAHEIEIRPCSSVEEFAECVRIEHAIWGESIAVPVPMFVVAHHSGGEVLGAYVGGKLVGFTLAYAGMRAGKQFVHSHMAAVLPAYRDRGVGRALKLFQRREALARGIDLMEWTFDPLDLKNGYFNLVRLGAVARRYIPNCYGVTDSPLHAGLPTDRLVAEWWLASDRVKDALEGVARPASSPTERVAISSTFAALREKDRAAAVRLQSDFRERFQSVFGRGYAATRIESGESATEYILEPLATIAGLNLAAAKQG